MIHKGEAVRFARGDVKVVAEKRTPIRGQSEERICVETPELSFQTSWMRDLLFLRKLKKSGFLTPFKNRTGSE